MASGEVVLGYTALSCWECAVFEGFFGCHFVGWLIGWLVWFFVIYFQTVFMVLLSTSACPM